jgi:hypothetical protein
MKSYELVLALIDEPGRYATEDPKLVPGDHVKLGFRCDRGCPYQNEWMFLEVTAVDGAWPDAVYRGELCNRPVFIDPDRLRVGQPVEFRNEHIYQVIHDSPSRPEGEREHPLFDPTAKEYEQARAAYRQAFGEDTDLNRSMVIGRAAIYAMVRQYPKVAPLLGTLDLDARRGFGSIDVGLPNDPKYTHVFLRAWQFLAYALTGLIVLGEDSQPDYIGTERLRGE